MKTKKYLFLAAAAMAFAACSNDDDAVNAPVEARIMAGVNTPETRALNNQWEQDAIGVMVTEVSGTTQGVTSVMKDLYKNVKYTTTANSAAAATFTSEGEGIFFQDANETVTFAAYAPYQESAANALPGTNGVIEGSTADQGDRTKQQAFDYIYASGATATRSNPTVQFQATNAFMHKMTRLVIIVKTSAQDGFTAEQVTSGTYTLSGLNHSGQFDVTTGTAQATGTTVTDDWSLTSNSLKTEGETDQVTFTSILYPQTLTDNLTFKAVIDGQTYTNNTIKPDLDPRKSNTVTITVKKTGLTISGCIVSDWGNGNDYIGDATM